MVTANLHAYALRDQINVYPQAHQLAHYSEREDRGGRRTFRHDIFGGKGFWGGTLTLHQRPVGRLDKTARNILTRRKRLGLNYNNQPVLCTNDPRPCSKFFRGSQTRHPIGH